MFYQIFLSPQVKRWTIITRKDGIYELLHELPNDLRLKDLRKLGNIRKLSKLHRVAIPGYPSAQAPCQNESFVKSRRKLLKNRN